MKPLGLQSGFSLEVKQPTVKCCLDAVKDLSIPNFPKFPGSKKKDFHKKGGSCLILGLLDPSCDIIFRSPNNAKPVPATDSKVTFKKQVFN